MLLVLLPQLPARTLRVGLIQALAVMAKFVALAILLSAASLPAIADACRRMTPNTEALEQYTSVFVGRVTGLHLKGYENRLLGKPDLIDPELGPVTITNGASPVSVNVAVTQLVRGPASGAVELSLAGCTFELPQLRDRGIFFVQPDGAFAVVIWERDQAAFNAWLSRLGVAQNDR